MYALLANLVVVKSPTCICNADSCKRSLYPFQRSAAAIVDTLDRHALAVAAQKLYQQGMATCGCVVPRTSVVIAGHLQLRCSACSRCSRSTYQQQQHQQFDVRYNKGGCSRPSANGIVRSMAAGGSCVTGTAAAVHSRYTPAHMQVCQPNSSMLTPADSQL